MLLGAERNLADCTNRWFSSGFARRVRQRLELLAGSLDMANGPLSGMHNDFWPGNIFVSRRGIQVIDFEGYAEGLPFLDPAYFLVQTELFFAYPGLSSRFRHLENAFLRGWLDGDTPDAPALALARTAMALQVLVRTPRQRGLKGPRLWRRVARLRSILVRS
jgi:aminoglycoside phosphotransferase (APT) family kinase protein